jgi:hypothetical protein
MRMLGIPQDELAWVDLEVFPQYIRNFSDTPWLVRTRIGYSAFSIALHNPDRASFTGIVIFGILPDHMAQTTTSGIPT